MISSKLVNRKNRVAKITPETETISYFFSLMLFVCDLLKHFSKLKTHTSPAKCNLSVSKWQGGLDSHADMTGMFNETPVK